METDDNIEIPLVPHSIDMIVDEVLKRISPNVSKPPKDKSSNIYAYIIDVEDPDYQDYYRISFSTNQIATKKSQKIWQNSKSFKVVKTLTLPASTPIQEYKKAIKPITFKLPEVGRMKYNFMFNKNDIENICNCINSIGEKN